MKAKKLAEILLKNPNLNVVMYSQEANQFFEIEDIPSKVVLFRNMNNELQPRNLIEKDVLETLEEYLYIS